MKNVIINLGVFMFFLGLSFSANNLQGFLDLTGIKEPGIWLLQLGFFIIGTGFGWKAILELVTLKPEQRRLR